MCCMSASGHFVDPMIVMPGKTLTVNPTEDFKECAIRLSESGLFVCWLSVFVKALGEQEREKTCHFVSGWFCNEKQESE